MDTRPEPFLPCRRILLEDVFDDETIERLSENSRSQKAHGPRGYLGRRRSRDLERKGPEQFRREADF
jgi:hypothetical protein